MGSDGDPDREAVAARGFSIRELAVGTIWLRLMSRTVAFTLALIVPACSTSTSDPKPTDEADAAPRPPQATAKSPEPLPLPASDQALSPAVPVVVVTESVTNCAELPQLPPEAPDTTRALTPALEALRGLSCGPELMGLALSQIRTRLKTPDTVPLNVGRRYGAVTLETPTALTEIATAAGVPDPHVKFRQGWGTSWRLVSGPEGKAPQPWGAATLVVDVGGPRHSDTPDGTVQAIPAGMVASALSVVFVPEVLRFEPDPEAGRAAVSALRALAAERALLAGKPEAAHDKLAVLGERFGLSAYSVHSGDAKRSGFDIRPRRTQLRAHDFAAAMGFDLAKTRQTTIDITDVNPNRLEVDGKTEIAYRGLELEVDLSREGDALGLARWVVDEISVLPAP